MAGLFPLMSSPISGILSQEIPPNMGIVKEGAYHARGTENVGIRTKGTYIDRNAGGQ